jgi:ATP-dependent Clp endopeptidase proteolytic subunit ClpP
MKSEIDHYKEINDKFSKEQNMTFNPRCELIERDGESHVYLEGGVYDDEDGISAKKVRSLLKGDVTVHLNSPGGSTFEGLAIYNALKDHPGHVTVQIDGIAASAASIIAMGANKITARPSSMMMIHRGWTIAIGNAEELRKTADKLVKVDEASDKAYLSRFNGRPEELEQMLDDATYLTADDAYAVGLIDEILDKEEPVQEPEEEPIEEPKKTLFDNFKASVEGVNFYSKFRRN